jgi:hypothetical protein
MSWLAARVAAGAPPLAVLVGYSCSHFEFLLYIALCRFNSAYGILLYISIAIDCILEQGQDLCFGIEFHGCEKALPQLSLNKNLYLLGIEPSHLLGIHL